MSKRNVPKQPMIRRIVPVSVIEADNLQTIQVKHLNYLEEWSSKFPKLYGVDVCKMFTYELIQVLNNEHLRTQQQAKESVQENA